MTLSNRPLENIVTSDFKLGIIAGGQLGKMLIQEASKWGILTYVMDADEECPAGKIATRYIKGSHKDYDSVYNFGKLVDLLTFEIESVNLDAIKKLEDEGIQIRPSPKIIEIVQDKGIQRQFLEKNQIPVPRYKLMDTSEEILAAVSRGEIDIPFVQKLRKGGYDGRGVHVVNCKEDLQRLLHGPSIIEEKVTILKEISVIVARNESGEIRAYPVVEMIFDPVANLVEMLICPAKLEPRISEEATQIAINIAYALKICGLLAVEFFVDTSGRVLVNEISPRPHNSGHHTIEAVHTSQFEQHLRAILNLPLGSTKLRSPAVMINILGMEGHDGVAVYEGLTECLEIDGAKIHLYGKKLTKPHRKMGHVTVLSDDLDDALEKAEKIKRLIKVKSWKES